MIKKLLIILTIVQAFSLKAEALFDAVTEGSITIQNMSNKYDIGIGFGNFGKYTRIKASKGGQAQFSIEQDKENKELGYFTLHLKAYNLQKSGDDTPKVIERKSVRIYGPLALLGTLNENDNELHIDYNKHSKNGHNLGKFKIKFKPDDINKKVKIRQLFSSNV